MKLGKIFQAAPACALILLFGLSGIQAQDKKIDYSKVVGTWIIEMEGRNGNIVSSEWTLTVKEDKLVATIPGRMGRGRGGNTQENIQIEDIKFDGKTLSFAVERTMRDRTIKIDYSADVKDGKMTGSMAMGDRFTREFTGKLKKK